MSKTRRIALDGMLAALYFALSYLTIESNVIRVAFTSLAIIVAALMFGPIDACAVALLGETLFQLLRYGPGPTTLIWLAPPVLHALCLGLGVLLFSRKGTPLVERTVPCYAVCLFCGALNAVFNTVALYFDSIIYHYYSPETFFVNALIRVGIALATAAVLTAVAIPLVRKLRSGLA
jgi:uncharacterized membrane protein